MKALVMHRLKGRDNPYMSLLINALSAAGVEVAAPVGGRSRLWKSVFGQRRPDVVHLQWQHNYFTGATPWVALRRSTRFLIQVLGLRLARVPIVWTVHNIVNHEGRQARWELLMCRILARSVSKLIVHCEEAVELVAAAYRVTPRRIRVVPHGNYIGVYPEPSGKELARRELGIDTTGKVLLFFGQVRPYKGLEELLGAFARLEDPDIRLVLVGEPKFGMADLLREETQRDARVIARLEFVPDDELINYIAASDLVVLPYRKSLTSGAAILAFSCARPVVAPRLGCMQAFPSEAAVLFHPDSSDGLEGALRLALSKPLEQMGGAASDYVGQFSWPYVANRTIEVYREVAHGAGLSSQS